MAEKSTIDMPLAASRPLRLILIFLCVALVDVTGARARPIDELRRYWKAANAALDELDVARAQAEAHRAIGLATRIFGADDPRTGNGYLLMARALYVKAEYPEAEKLARRALSIREASFGPDDVRVGRSLRVLANILSAQSKLEAAEKLLIRSRLIAERMGGGDDREIFRVRSAQLRNLYEQTRFEEVSRLGDETLGQIATIVDFEPRLFAQISKWTGSACLQLGRFARAELLLRNALAGLEKSRGGDGPEAANILQQLARVFVTTGRYAEGEPIASRALAINQRVLGPNHAHTSKTIGVLGTINLKIGDADKAVDLFRREFAATKARVGEDHPDAALALRHLGAALRQQTKYAESLAAYRRARDIYSRHLGEETLPVADSDAAIGRVLNIMQQPAEAATYLMRSLYLRQKLLGPAHPSLAATQLRLGQSALRQGQIERALGWFDGAAKVAITRGEELRRNSQEILLESERRVPTLIFEGVVAAALRLRREGADNRDLEDKAYVSAQHAIGTLTEAAISQMAARFSAKDDDLGRVVRARQDAHRRLIGLQEQLAVSLGKSGDSDAVKIRSGLRSSADQAAREVSDHDAELKRRFPLFAALTHPAPVTIAETQSLLSPSEALVLILATHHRTFVWAISHDAYKVHAAPLSRDELTQRIVLLRQGLDPEELKQSAVRGAPRLFDLGAAHQLYQDLLAPVQDVIAGKTNLLIVPSGPLTSFPMHLLVTDAPAVPRPTLTELGRYREAAWLLKQQTMTVLPAVSSLKLLRQLTRRAKASEPFIGFGNPILGGPSELPSSGTPHTRAAATGFASVWKGRAVDQDALRRILVPLPETAAELRRVAASLGSNETALRLGEAASERAVQSSDLNRYRVVYFATHGLVAGEVDGLSEPALVMSLPAQPSPDDDGLLTASEIADLKLNADWVVLSACNTAAGNKPGAEALSGLARAFFYAGARAVLVSHWRVSSEAAASLMTRSFAALRSGKISRAAALRDSMLAYLQDETDPWNAYPAFWAPFVIVGVGS